MTPVEARNTLIKKYFDTFSGQFPILTDNQLGKPPESPLKWVRIAVKFDDGNADSLGSKGNRRYLRAGTLNIQVFTGANKGTDENDELAEDSIAIYDGEKFGDLWLFNGRVETVGSDGEYYHQNSIIEFNFEYIR
jgi:hypothetical protein